MIVKVNNQIGILKPDGVFLIGTKTYSNDPYELINPDDYGDHQAEKVCNICHLILPVDNFQINQNGKGDRQIRRPSCNDCRKEIDGIGMTNSDKNDWNKIKPHLVDFTCPICDKTTIPGLTSKVVLNHDHKSGKITGWICDSCNTGLGRFKDDIDVLFNAMIYLEKHVR